MIGHASRTTLFAPSPLLGGAAIALACLSLFIGYAPLGIAEVLGGLLGEGGTAAIVVQEIRLPRAGLALLVGAILGMAGAALQGLTRNPLAEPGITGVSAAASLGAVVALYFGWGADATWTVPLSAMAGAAAATLLLLGLAQGAGTMTLILSGVAISSLCGALTALALNLAPNAYAVSEIVFWTLGSFKDRGLPDLALAAPFVLAGFATLATASRGLDALSLGEEAALTLGIDVGRLRLTVVIGVAVGVGAAVAVAGAIGFVGLIVPHLLRPWVGERPSRLLWPSAFGGAGLVLMADMAVRLLPTNAELMLGVVTAMVGAPFFLWLMIRTPHDASHTA